LGFVDWVFASEHTVGEKVHNVGYRSFLLRKDSELWIPNYGKISDKIDSMDKTLKELTNAILKLAEKSAK